MARTITRIGVACAFTALGLYTRDLHTLLTHTNEELNQKKEILERLTNFYNFMNENNLKLLREGKPTFCIKDNKDTYTIESPDGVKFVLPIKYSRDYRYVGDTILVPRKYLFLDIRNTFNERQ